VGTKYFTVSFSTPNVLPYLPTHSIEALMETVQKERF